jgi:PAS domain-containing protein
MYDRQLFENVGAAHERLIELAGELRAAGERTPGPRLAAALGSLQRLFDGLWTRFGLLRAMLEQSEDVVFAKDLRGRYAYINARGAELFQRPAEQLLGATEHELFEPREAQRRVAVDREVLLSQVPQTATTTARLGQRSVRLFTATNLWRDGNARILGTLGSMHEVSRLRVGQRRALTERARLRARAVELALSGDPNPPGDPRQRRRELSRQLVHVRVELQRLEALLDPRWHEPIGAIVELLRGARRALLVPQRAVPAPVASA